MYKKGDWVRTRDTAQKMMVQRDQLGAGPDRHLVWCEWEAPSYNLRAYFSGDLARMEPAAGSSAASRPADAGTAADTDISGNTKAGNCRP